MWCGDHCYEYHFGVCSNLSIRTEYFGIGLFWRTVLDRFGITTIYIHILVINKKRLLLNAILKPNFIYVISFIECNMVWWVPVSLTSKVSNGCIRDLEFDLRLHQKVISVLV